MRLGFIVGRGNEVYRNDALKKKTPKKFLVDNLLHVDVAIAMTVKENYPGVDVDIILPKEITLQRFKKNDIIIDSKFSLTVLNLHLIIE